MRKCFFKETYYSFLIEILKKRFVSVLKNPTLVFLVVVKTKLKSKLLWVAVKSSSAQVSEQSDFFGTTES